MSNVGAPSVLALYSFWRYSSTRLLNFLEALYIFHWIELFTKKVETKYKSSVVFSIEK